MGDFKVFPRTAREYQTPHPETRTWRLEVGERVVNGDGAGALVADDLDAVPGRVVQAQVGGATPHAAGTLVQVQVQVAAHHLHAEEVALRVMGMSERCFRLRSFTSPVRGALPRCR